jgi:NAD(P)-dependent dehydrogenase (short-subunit alcohol dehydrogenase family)
MKTEGRVVLITGASRGIGKAIAGMFASQGDRIAVHYHADRAGAEATLAGLLGHTHKIFQADLARPEEAQRLVEEVLHAMERIDVLVNNAGMFAHHPIADIGFQDWVSIWEHTLNTNLLGAAHASYWASRAMIRQGGGKIINITSRGAFRGEPDAPAYGASKAGMNAMSQSLAKALAPYGIMVYAIAPGWVATDMAAPYLEGVEGDAVRNQSPLGRVADPDEIARTALFLASPGTDYLTGCIIDVNGASYLRT